MAQAKRDLFKSADVCELAELQPYVLRSWEAEFPNLGKPSGGSGRLYGRADVELVLRIKQLVFGEGLTLAGARRRLEEEQESPTPSVAAVAVDHVFGDVARKKLREVRAGLEAILQMVSRETPSAVTELTLVPPAVRSSSKTAPRRRRAS